LLAITYINSMDWFWGSWVFAIHLVQAERICCKHKCSSYRSFF